MAQIKNGTVSTADGSYLITGQGTTFISSGVSAGDIFTVKGTNIGYEVSSVTSEEELLLSAPYVGDYTESVYTIVNDFTSPSNIPYINQGDIETAFVLKRSINRIQELFNVNSKWDVLVATGTSYNIQNGVNIFVDMSGVSSFQINLPASPSSGYTVSVGDYSGTFESKPLSISGNGSKIHGSSEPMSLDKNNLVVRFVYLDSNVGWKVV